jgi:C-terminal processing protease CtpA/Prc
MKKLLYLILAALPLISACEKDNDKNNVPNPYSDVNAWIYSNMKTYYLWEEHIPAKTDRTLSPDDYFSSLLYKPEDRFSWIQENYTDLLNSLSGVQMEAGYEYTLYYKDRVSNDIIGVVTYVKPNSPAALTPISVEENTRLKRGDIFIAINGERMNTDNYRTLLAKTKEPHLLGLAVYPYFDNVAHSVSLQVVEYKENPIFLDTIYEIDGRKIGYLVYNFFARDNGDKSFDYEKELNAVFGQFKSKGINDLILDMRYNGGGAVTTAIALASMIANQSSADIFSIAQYNDIITRSYQQQGVRDYDKDYFVDKISGTNIAINKLDMERLYVIATNGTASASELIINGLRPYLSGGVIIVGDTTYGKNVGSFSIYDEGNSRNKWGMQPIVVKVANKNLESDYGRGFAPDIKVNENSGGHPFKQLGDTEEIMLKAALAHLFWRRSTPARATSRNYDTRGDAKMLWSSKDRTPARKNMYVEMPQIHE